MTGPTLPVDHPLADARAGYFHAYELWRYGNKHGGALKRGCVKHFNRARANLARTIRAIEGRPVMQYTPSFYTKVKGIPCGVVVTHYQPAEYNNHGHPDSRLPDEPAEIEWFLVDRNGYKAEWWERKMSPEDVEAVCVEIEKRGGL
jgi:hypothetical protein